MLESFFYAYAGDGLSVASPGNLIFHTFPPVFVAVGTYEILFDDSFNFFNRIGEVQPNVQLKIYGGQGHVFTQLDISSPAAQDLIDNINGFFSA